MVIWGAVDDDNLPYFLDGPLDYNFKNIPSDLPGENYTLISLEATCLR
jgi:hypothetical protein